jgi:hypothetical protein
MTLIERLQAATGPDRELDAAIWRLTDPEKYSIWESGQRAMLERDCDEKERQYHLNLRAKIAAPAYTASIDVALTLGGHRKWPNNPFALICSAMLLCRSGKVADLPRFICIAALKAWEIE